MKPSSWALFLSLSLILQSLFFGGLVVGGQWLVVHHEPRVVEVEYLKPENLSVRPQKQWVRQQWIPEKLKAQESEDPLRFLSKERQRVREQTQAKRTGEQIGAPESQMAADSRQSDETRSAESEKTGLLNLPRPQLQGSQGFGAFVDEGLKIGEFTALNTDRHLFYSFYERANRLLSYRWSTRVRRAEQQLSQEQLAMTASPAWTTLIEIQLRPTGEVLKVSVMKESGLPAFDQAAVEAIQEVRLFPNPPREMVDEDGLIRLSYSFRVYSGSRPLARP